MRQELDVYLHQAYAGRLTRTSSGAISFTYDPGYLAQGLPSLSVSMPSREKPYRGRVVESFFFTPLPDFVVWRRRNSSRLLRKLLWEFVPDSLARGQKARYFYLSNRERFAFLADKGISAGAVELCPYGTTLAEWNAHDEIDEILDGNLIQKISANPESAAASMGGQKNKIPVYIEEESGALIWVKGRKAVPSTHILKNLGELDSVINELFCMRLAQSIGLRTPAVEMRSVDGVSCLLVERYDRVQTDSKEIKVLHQETFGQALSLAPGVVSERRGGPTIKRCLDLLDQYSAELERDQIDFLTQIVFSYLIGRHDFNGRNLSLLYRRNQPELAPAHDLMGSFNSRSTLDMTIAGVRFPEKVHVRDWRRAVGESIFPVLHQQLVRLPRECLEKSRALLKEFEHEGLFSDQIAIICSRVAQNARVLEQQLSGKL